MRIYLTPQLLAILALGFASGMPFLLTLSTLSFWLTEAGVSKTAIGLFMLVSLPYCLKFLWAPLLDQKSVPFLTARLGHRRSWAFIAQIGLIVSLLGLGASNPQNQLSVTACYAALVSFFSATQDIVIDAYRIEAITPHYSGAGAAMEAIGFRFGMIVSGAGTLYLAAALGWQLAYWIMAAFVSIGMITIWIIPEPQPKIVLLNRYRTEPMPWIKKLKVLFWVPWQYIISHGHFFSILAFIFFFKLADTVLNAMGAPFLYELGFSKIEFAHITKVFGVSLMVLGGLIGGVMINRIGTVHSLIMCAALQIVSCLMFAIQALVGYNLAVLMITVGVESFCSGMASAGFIAYISSFCQPPYTASHFTLLYSFGSLCRVLISSLAGWSADHITWTFLFFLTAVGAIPAIILIQKMERKSFRPLTSSPPDYQHVIL